MNVSLLYSTPTINTSNQSPLNNTNSILYFHAPKKAANSIISTQQHHIIKPLRRCPILLFRSFRIILLEDIIFYKGHLGGSTLSCQIMLCFYLSSCKNCSKGSQPLAPHHHNPLPVPQEYLVDLCCFVERILLLALRP